MKIFTIGFTNKKAIRFFESLREAGVRRVIDVRLSNVSQLAGFSKKDDLKYFLRTLVDIDYIHLPVLAPTREMLDAYKKHGGDWIKYEQQFLNLMRDRRIETIVAKDLVDQGCLLCSEDKPHRCHRRLVADYLTQQWGGVTVEHIT
jgi:uncharacterized protein (DUF488 family)